MKRCGLIVAVVMFLFSSIAFAETIHLKSGRSVNGTITSETDKFYKMDVGGVVITLYKDDVDSVEGVDGSSSVTKSSSKTKSSSSKSKNELILQFIEAFGTRSMMEEQLNMALQKVPPAQQAKYRAAFDVDEITEELIPIYDKYFTRNDLQAYIDFYESAEGQKMIETLPKIMQDTVTVSLQYFRKKLPEEFKN